MLAFATAEDYEIRGPVGDWLALRSNPDYRADWRVHGGASAVVESAGFALRAQTEADLKAARWGLLAWENPRERSRFRPFWIDEKMLVAEVAEPKDPIGTIVRVAGIKVSGLRLLDGALVFKVQKGRRVEQIRISQGEAFDLERSGLKIWYPVDAIPPTATPRLCNLDMILSVRRRPSSARTQSMKSRQ